MTAGDAALKIVGDVEECTIAVGDPGIERQQIGRYRRLVAGGAAHLELFDRACGPYRPMAEQAASKIGACRDSVIAQVERQREVEQDVVVIAGIKRDAIERARGRLVQVDAVSAASSSTGLYRPTSRMANCVVWTPTASPPAPASM